MSATELDDIRGALWQLLAEVKAGELDAETGDTAAAILDSLIDAVRLETTSEATSEASPVASEAHDTEAKGVSP